MIELIIVFTFLCFLLFGAVDFYFVQVEHLKAEHVLNYYLDRTRLEGYLTAQDEADMISAFKSVGLTVVSVEGPREAAGDERVLRPSEVSLAVTASFDKKPFIVGTLIGSSPQGVLMKVKGDILSERISP
jgi:hypothetical protein